MLRWQHWGRMKEKIKYQQTILWDQRDILKNKVVLNVQGTTGKRLPDLYPHVGAKSSHPPFDCLPRSTTPAVHIIPNLHCHKYDKPVQTSEPQRASLIISRNHALRPSEPVPELLKQYLSRFTSKNYFVFRARLASSPKIRYDRNLQKTT